MGARHASGVRAGCATAGGFIDIHGMAQTGYGAATRGVWLTGDPRQRVFIDVYPGP